MPLDVSEVLGLGRDIERAGGRVGAKAAKAVRQSAQELKMTAQAIAPVLTGALRSSITIQGAGDGRGASVSATVGSSLRYAGYVEDGTSRTPPQPFLGPALDSVEPSFISALEQASEEALP